MSELFLVRHAQASYGTGDYDRLSDLGHQQAHWLGEYFHYRKLHFDTVICGNMVRHRETLEGISTGMGNVTGNQTIIPQWNEFDFESLVGAYLADHPDQIPAADSPPGEFWNLLKKTLYAWSDNQLNRNVPESWSEFEQRVRDALTLSTQNTESANKTLVVSSGGAISMVLRHILNAPPTAMIQMNLQVRNSSFSHLYFNQESVQISGFNHIPHLDHPERAAAVTYY